MKYIKHLDENFSGKETELNEAVNASGYLKAGKLGVNDQFLGRRSLAWTLSVDLGLKATDEYVGPWIGFDHVSMYAIGKKGGTILDDALTNKYTYDELKKAAADFLGIKESVVNEQMDLEDELANDEFGMDFDQLGSKEKDWVRDEMENTKVTEAKVKVTKKDIKDIEDSGNIDIAYKKAMELLKSLSESVVNEAKFVKEFDKEVLDAKTKKEVTEVYPKAKFYVGKSNHFFGDLEDNLFFKAYYTKGQKEFEIRSVYSKKGSNYVYLFNESLTEAYSDEQRMELADKGFALSDGSYPIKDLKDLKNAIMAYGRAKDQSRTAKFIVKRAKALGAEDLIPDTDDFQKSLKA